MARKANSVYFTPTAGGTTDWTFSAAVTGYNSPALASMVGGGTYTYRAESSDLSQWEIGEGVWNGTVLTRASVLYNSSGTGSAAGQSGAGTKINFTAVPNVGVVELQKDMLGIEEANPWTYLQQAQARANIGALKKNYVVNGAMQVSQENGSGNLTGSGGYPADQWSVNYSNGGSVSFSQVASVTPGGSPNRLRVTVTAADTVVGAGDLAGINQRIEGLRVADLRSGSASAKTITVQFGCRGPAGTYCVSIRNAVGNRSYVAEYTITAGEANTDVVKSVVIPLDQAGTWVTDTGIGLDLWFALMNGSTYQTPAGAWAAGNLIGSANQFNFMGTVGNVFELFDVGLYEGAVAPAFQVPDYPHELALCQRYYYSIGSNSVSLNTVAMAAGMSGTQAMFHFPFPVQMRVPPNVSATGSGAFRIDGPGVVGISSFAFTGITEKSARGIATVSSGLASAAAYVIDVSAGGTMVANARM